MYVRQDDDLLFKNWHWGKCLDYLYNNICYQSSNLVLIRGALDSGKTTLKQELIRILPENCKVFSMFGEIKVKLGVVELIKKITAGFGESWDNDNFSGWQSLQRAVFSQQNVNWIILIDDAEKLCWEHLDSLLNLYNTIEISGGQLSLVFFSDFTFDEGMNKALLADFMNSKGQIIDLQPLNLEQTSEFLNDKMQLQFNHKILKKIYNASDGLIGKIKHLAVSELNINSSKGNTMFKNLFNNIINPPVVRAIICSGFLLLSYIAFTFQKNTKKEDLAQDGITNTYISKASTKDQQNELEKKAQLSKDKEIIYAKDKQHLEKQLEEIDNLSKQLQTISSELNKIKDQVAELSFSINSLHGSTLNISKSSNNLKSNKLHAIDPMKKLAYIDSLRNYEQQLLKVNKKFYVLQIMSSKNEQSIKNLIDRYSPLCPNSIKYASGNLQPNKELWYVAWYGIYQDKQSALKDLSNLPRGLQTLNPIVKDYSAVHKLINSKKD
jgi:septal ring-binding cell division protein DamX/type II secretory pathway predicted ATPase ExeA